jgi:hypothetical protein
MASSLSQPRQKSNFERKANRESGNATSFVRLLTSAATMEAHARAEGQMAVARLPARLRKVSKTIPKNLPPTDASADSPGQLRPRTATPAPNPPASHEPREGARAARPRVVFLATCSFRNSRASRPRSGSWAVSKFARTWKLPMHRSAEHRLGSLAAIACQLAGAVPGAPIA